MAGGADGPALTLARQTLAAGKALVTANKAMLAHHGLSLAQLAEEKDTPLKYEAAVAGGIPVIKAIREGASANAARKSVASGKSVSVRVDLGGRSIINKKNNKETK